MIFLKDMPGKLYVEMRPVKERNRELPNWGVSFVMTLWLEPHEREDPPVWRWHVRHIQSGAEGYFKSMATMLEFIEEKASVSPPSYP